MLILGRISKCKFRISLKFSILDFVPGIGYPWIVVSTLFNFRNVKSILPEKYELQTLTVIFSLNLSSPHHEGNKNLSFPQ